MFFSMKFIHILLCCPLSYKLTIQYTIFTFKHIFRINDANKLRHQFVIIMLLNNTNFNGSG